MKKRTVFRLLLAVIVVAGAALYGLTASRTFAKSPTIMEFSTMVGVTRPYTGSANAIRGISGGGLPWVIGGAEGELKQSGKLEITVTGLVIDPNDPTAISRGLAGTNPSPSFKAIVSCQTIDGGGNAVVENVSTGLFPATTTGNASIEGQVALPAPCIAPIVFVASPANAWFAATGH